MRFCPDDAGLGRINHWRHNACWSVVSDFIPTHMDTDNLRVVQFLEPGTAVAVCWLQDPLAWWEMPACHLIKEVFDVASRVWRLKKLFIFVKLERFSCFLSDFEGLSDLKNTLFTISDQLVCFYLNQSESSWPSTGYKKKKHLHENV